MYANFKILPEQVVEINQIILSKEAGLKGANDYNKLHGALGRIDNGYSKV